MELFKKQMPESARPSFPREVLPPSTIRLIEALEKENDNRELDGIIDLAHRQYWHDFDSEIEMPKVALARTLITFGKKSLAERVAREEFDSGMDEAEVWFSRNRDQIERMIKDAGGEHKVELLMREYFAMSGRLDSNAMNRIFQRIVSNKSKKKGRRWHTKKL